MPELSLEDPEVIGENDHWRFYVARCGDRWLGFAGPSATEAAATRAFHEEGLKVGESLLCIFPEVADGYHLGVLDKTRAVLLTGAVAQDPESAYGGVERWHVPPELRGDPERLRCRFCEEIGCDGGGNCPGLGHDFGGAQDLYW